MLRKRTSSKAYLSELFDVLPGALPVLVILVLIPFALYLSNQEDFDHNLKVVIPHLVVAVVFLIVLALIPVVFHESLRAKIITVLFYIGVYFFLADILVPVQLGELTGDASTPTEPLHLTFAEFGLVIAVVLSAVFVPWEAVRTFASVFVLVLFTFQLIVVFTGLSPDTRIKLTSLNPNLSHPLPATEDPGGRYPSPRERALGGNVYHITFDGYAAPVFTKMTEETQRVQEFSGFTFFKKNRSNYDTTKLSVPSYMTGSFYEGNESLSAWRWQYLRSGVASELYDAGYRVSMYTFLGVNEKASYVRTHQDAPIPQSTTFDYLRFGDLWLVRVVPNILQREVFHGGEGLFSRLILRDKKLRGLRRNVLASVKMMRQLLEDEQTRADRGEYVYAHLWVPHAPSIVNRDCIASLNPDADVHSTDSKRYEEQARCATKLMVELIRTLKELGRYHAATIIFQSDHGVGFIEDPDYEMPLELIQKLKALTQTDEGRALFIEKLNGRTNALLLIKPPLKSEKRLAVSQRPTQLADVPATISELVHVPVRTKEGTSVFSSSFPEGRAIHMFVGLRRRDEQGQKYELAEGELSHFSMKNGHWKLYPNVPFFGHKSFWTRPKEQAFLR